MDLLTITDLKELKAMAYDQLVSKELAESNLRAINQRIADLEAIRSTEDSAKPKK